MKAISDKELQRVSGGGFQPVIFYKICTSVNGQLVCRYERAGSPPLHG